MLKKGERLGRPSNCTDEMYALMRSCWELDPKARPTFEDLYHRLTAIEEARIDAEHALLTGGGGDGDDLYASADGYLPT